MLKPDAAEQSQTEFEREVKSNFVAVNIEKDEHGQYKSKAVANMYWAWIRREETLHKPK